MSALAKGQIINVESLRFTRDSLGFYGQENFNLDLTKNTQRLFTFNNNLALQYQKPRNTWMLLSNLNFSFSDNSDFERDGYFHLRYAWDINDILALEAFEQYQVDVPLRIEQRILSGLGLRAKLKKQEGRAIYFGSAVMYEYDVERGTDNINTDFRMSNYLTTSMKSNSGFRMTGVVYYQPRLNYWADFRLSGQLQLAFTLFKNLDFASTASLNYDAFPVQGFNIPNLTYKLVNGVVYTF